MVIRASLIGDVLPCSTWESRSDTHALCGRDSTQERITLQRGTTDASGDRLPHNGVIDQRCAFHLAPIDGREIPPSLEVTLVRVYYAPACDSIHSGANRVELRSKGVRAYCSRDYLLIGRPRLKNSLASFSETEYLYCCRNPGLRFAQFVGILIKEWLFILG